MTSDTIQPAKRPREDELAYFIALANSCCAEAMGALKVPLKLMAEIDGLFVDLIPGLGAVKPAAAGILVVNAHATWRAAVRLGLSGQVLPTFMALRGCIESVLYAIAIARKPDLQAVWLDRDKSRAARRRCRDEFAIGKLFAHLSQAQDKAFADVLKEYYDGSIDFGAHPNKHSLVGSTMIEEVENGLHTLKFAYIQGCDSFELRQSLVACAEVGIAVFLASLIAHPSHADLKRLNDDALQLQKAIPWLVKEFGLEADGINSTPLP